MNYVNRFKYLGYLGAVSTGLSILLTACGGNSTSLSSTTPTTPISASSFGMANVALTDAPGNFNHVWVTVTQIAFHMDPNATWSATDASWKKYTLPTPVTVDLAALNNGVLSTSEANLASLFQGIQLPVGTYTQMRLFMDGAYSALDSSAQNTSDGSGNALQYNDQVEQDNNGTLTEAPLEIPFLSQGIRLNGSFNISAGSTLNLALDVNLDKSIVSFKHNNHESFVLSPWLSYFDLQQVGAISGTINTAQLCLLDAHYRAIPLKKCAYNLVVKAEAVDPVQGRFASLRSTAVDPKTGVFTLYPVPVKDSTGNPIDYHVLVRGRNMTTMVIKHVPVTINTTPASGATVLPALTPTILNGAEYTAQFASALSPLTAGYAVFMQTDPSESYPYSVRYRATDPFIGSFYNPIALTNAGLQTATYAASGLNFSPVTPKEGVGNYSVGVDDFAQYLMDTTFSTLTAPTSGSTTTFTANAPTLSASAAAGTISGTIKGSSAAFAKYNHVQIVFVRAAHIVSTQDLSSQLQALTASNLSINYTQNNIPAGTSALPNPMDVYSAYLRAWNDGSTAAAVKRETVPLNGVADLRSTNTATLNGDLNQ